MDELISKASAIDALEKIDCSDGVGISSLKCDAVDDAITVIKALPTVDAVPVRYGHWINIMEGNALRRKCSVCGEVFIANSDKHDFCGCCGADMRKDSDGNG